MQLADVEREVRDIRRWLMENRGDTPERQRLTSVLPSLEAYLAERQPPTPTDRDAFAEAFNSDCTSGPCGFRPIRHVLIESCETEEPICSPGGGPVGADDEEWVSAAALEQLFTPTQREQLMDFMTTRRIPDRLFNGDEVGSTNAQQRLLLSAHILANGTYRPGSFEQRVHARMCWHWVQIVHHYAGATSASGPMAQGVMGGFDIGGGVVLGTGGSRSLHRGDRGYADELPEEEEAGGLGPIDEQTSHGEAATAEQEAREADPGAARRVHRRAAFPMERFDELQAGDWLWYYNANRSAGGSHSVIFSRWATGVVEPDDGVPYREAICYSQGTPQRGGREHRTKLGDRYSRAQRVFPITNVTRVSADARAAQTADELAPGPSGRRAERLVAANERFLQAKRRRLGRPVDITLLHAWIRAQNQNSIGALGDRLTAGQRALLDRANSSTDTEALTRLHQRLSALATNASVLGRNMSSTYDAGLDTRHAEALTRLEEQRAEIERELAELEAQQAPVLTGIDVLEAQRAQLDLTGEIRRLQREVAALWRQIRRRPRGAERDELQRQRRDLLDRIAELRPEQRSRRRDLRELTREIRTLTRQARRIQVRRRRVEGRRASGQGRLPYGLVHPGRLGDQDRRNRWSGLLADLRPQPSWSSLLEPVREPAEVDR